MLKCQKRKIVISDNSDILIFISLNSRTKKGKRRVGISVRIWIHLVSYRECLMLSMQAEQQTFNHKRVLPDHKNPKSSYYKDTGPVCTAARRHGYNDPQQHALVL